MFVVCLWNITMWWEADKSEEQASTPLKQLRQVCKYHEQKLLPLFSVVGLMTTDGIYFWFEKLQYLLAGVLDLERAWEPDLIQEISWV